jgi:hypothetical protein
VSVSRQSIGWREALDRSGVLSVLSAFDPRVAGTFPLGIAMPGSDIDVLCHAPDADVFARMIWAAFRGQPGFSMHQWVQGERAVIAAFALDGVPFELFGSPSPVDAQMGWRHFEVERRLLSERGARFREAVMAARRAGLKTEPAFAHVLGLSGDPYAALLELD